MPVVESTNNDNVLRIAVTGGHPVETKGTKNGRKIDFSCIMRFSPTEITEPISNPFIGSSNRYPHTNPYNNGTVRMITCPDASLVSFGI